MKRESAVAFSIATVAALTLLIAQYSPAQAAPSNDDSTAAMQQATEMVPAQASLNQTIDANRVNQGDQVKATLDSKVQLKNGPELPSGTQLVGQVSVDEMQNDGTYRLALVFSNAELKNGTVIPIKATIVRVYAPVTYHPLGMDISYAFPETYKWSDQTLQVDQPDALGEANPPSENTGSTASACEPVSYSPLGMDISYASEMADNWNCQSPAGSSEGVDLRSRVAGGNSGSFVSTKKDELRLSADSTLDLAIAAQGKS